MSRNQSQWFKESVQAVQSYTSDLREDAWLFLGALLAVGVVIFVLLSIRVLLRHHRIKADSALSPSPK